MSFAKNTQFNRMLRKASKRVLVGETPEEEAARLALEIVAHPVTRCEPGKRNPSPSRPGWSSSAVCISLRSLIAGALGAAARARRCIPSSRLAACRCGRCGAWAGLLEATALS